MILTVRALVRTNKIAQNLAQLLNVAKRMLLGMKKGEEKDEGEKNRRTFLSCARTKTQAKTIGKKFYESNGNGENYRQSLYQSFAGAVVCYLQKNIYLPQQFATLCFRRWRRTKCTHTHTLFLWFFFNYIFVCCFHFLICFSVLNICVSSVIQGHAADSQFFFSLLSIICTRTRDVEERARERKT